MLLATLQRARFVQLGTAALALLPPLLHAHWATGVRMGSSIVVNVFLAFGAASQPSHHPPLAMNVPPAAFAILLGGNAEYFF